METLKISTRLALLLLTTKKQFLLYNLKKDSNIVDQYRLTNDYCLTGNNREYNNFKVVSCIKNELTIIKL